MVRVRAHPEPPRIHPGEVSDCDDLTDEDHTNVSNKDLEDISYEDFSNAKAN